ncbi:hypothetical protein V2I01_15730 [Micromonospora sp. BRA006-A]|nr:hypothetical protein [Micromonospora sp. BRA006-A]
MGRWASGDQDIKRSTLDGQGDPGRASGPTRSRSTTPTPVCCCARTRCG